MHLIVPWTSGPLDSKIPKGLLGARTQPTCGTSVTRVTFFDIFFMIFWYPILSDFGANLAPTWPPKSTKNRQKIDQKINHFFDQFVYQFLIDFLVDSGTQVFLRERSLHEI